VKERGGDWIQTYTGRQFWPLDPRPEEVYIEDIAHALSLVCRFAGHCLTFYSVAQHSVLVSRIVPEHLVLQALLHDAAEAYIQDMVRPLKRHSSFGLEYQKFEEQLMAVIFTAFELDYTISKEIVEADNILLMTEKRDLMAIGPGIWKEKATPLIDTIQPWSPEQSEEIFLSTFRNNY
jgi:hypothetical protein